MRRVGLGCRSGSRLPRESRGRRVNVLVKGRDGPLPELTAADFELRDNGLPQEIELVASRHTPLSLILALDVSGSVEGTALTALKRAARGIIDRLEEGDQAALLTFSYGLQLDPRLGTDLAAVRTGIDVLHPGGGTSLVDGALAAMVLGDATPGRVAAVVLTDGKDTTSWLSEDEVLDTARQSDVVVYGVEVGTAKSVFLSRLSDMTGGSLLHVAHHGELNKALLDILEEFRARYLLRYTPRGVPRSGWHALSVRVKGRAALIRARKGYLSLP